MEFLEFFGVLGRSLLKWLSGAVTPLASAQSLASALEIGLGVMVSAAGQSPAFFDGVAILIGSELLFGYGLVLEQLRIGHHLPSVVDHFATLVLLGGCAFSRATLLGCASS